MNQNEPLMVMTELGEAASDVFGPNRRHWLILFLILVGLSAILLVPNPVAESTPNVEPVHDSWVSSPPRATEIPEDPYSKYAGHVVPHPRREPDALVTIKISRYDPELCRVSPTNCFDCSGGYCQSPLANGERWEDNYEVAIACPQQWPYYTLVEIDGQLWVCKDHGGKIVESRPGVYWVDQLSRTGHYPHGFEMEASVWFPN